MKAEAQKVKHKYAENQEQKIWKESRLSPGYLPLTAELVPVHPIEKVWQPQSLWQTAQFSFSLPGTFVRLEGEAIKKESRFVFSFLSYVFGCVGSSLLHMGFL